ncbi:VPEID-CTERM sorting domain-containing protein [Roseovarius aquimarinus]|uniref:VPEID-CTERM sorting domain-containing protein n=1 Tax=Roseovarius aquimarinus TaxID=1229156 RepID=A0ABW7I5G8_9RHOB
MTSLFKTLPVSAAILLASAASASAQERGSWWSNLWNGIFTQINWNHQTPAHNVPEIDASSGLLAGAAVLAALALTWEIRRRRRG